RLTSSLHSFPTRRSSDLLFSGKFLYVDDLVTRDSDRSRGFGGELLDWLIEQAREHGCENLELDSGVQRFDAHRFYFSKRMNISRSEEHTSELQSLAYLVC